MANFAFISDFCIHPQRCQRARDLGFFPVTKRVAPGYFYWKIEEK